MAKILNTIKLSEDDVKFLDRLKIEHKCYLYDLLNIEPVLIDMQKYKVIIIKDEIVESDTVSTPCVGVRIDTPYANENIAELYFCIEKSEHKNGLPEDKFIYCFPDDFTPKDKRTARLICEIMYKRIYQALFALSYYDDVFDVEEKTVKVNSKKTANKARSRHHNNAVKHYKVFKIKNAEDLKRTMAKHHTITCELWGVKGHYRRYKSGKTVYIAPYTKGRNKDKDITVTVEHKIIPKKRGVAVE